MRNRSLSQMLKKATKKQFNEFLAYLAANSSAIEEWNSCRSTKPSLGKFLLGSIIVTEETLEWAQRLKFFFEIEFSLFYPDTELDLEIIFFKNNPESMYSALLNHPSLHGSDEERSSFVITLGYNETRIINDLRRHDGLDDTVHIYCLPGELSMPFLASKSGRAGVHNMPMDPREYVKSLQALVPDLKTICLVSSCYSEDPAEFNVIRARRESLKKAFSHKKIQVIDHFWDFEDMYKDELHDVLPLVQAVVTLDEPAMHRYRKEVIELCNRFRVPLCASELNSVLDGAALGGGITCEAFAKPLVGLLHTLLNDDGYNEEEDEDRELSRQLPMQPGMRFNRIGMAKQGIDISDETDALLRMKSVFDIDSIEL